MMDRLEAFETMLADLQKQADYENQKLAELKAEGKEKTATYRQYFSNRLFLKNDAGQIQKIWSSG